MIDEYRISIIIPVYHVEEYILECLQSVVAQTVTEGVECVIVDDCGGDKSIDIAKRFIEEYHGAIDFKIVYRENNGGLSAARNSGIEKARGQYLYFLDSDDEITPNCMALMYSMVERYGEVDLVQGSFYENDKEKSTFSPYNMPEYSEDLRTNKTFLLRYEGDIIPAQSRLINRAFLIRHHLLFKEGIIHEDNYWSFFLAKYVNKMCFNKNRTYYHRYNPNSITGNINKKKESIAYKTIIHDLSQNIDSFLKGVQKTYILNNVLTAINNGYLNKVEVLSVFNCVNNQIERIILYLYFKLGNHFIKTKVLHLLIRIYKIY